jgi:hypothetical protein
VGDASQVEPTLIIKNIILNIKNNFNLKTLASINFLIIFAEFLTYKWGISRSLDFRIKMMSFKHSHLQAHIRTPAVQISPTFDHMGLQSKVE